MATAEAVQALLQREAAKPGAAWVSWDDMDGHGEEGCHVAAEALAILEETLSGRAQPGPTAGNAIV